jgi:uncharacterized cysteine cluster protein YcgN (CxxCxxCC family)
MSREEWESLCDGCGRCCLHKLEDVDSGLLFYTSVACRLFDHGKCRCSDYSARETLVNDCVVLSPGDTASFRWLPASCAYRRLDEGKSLQWWHPLVSGNPDTVQEAGISVRGRTQREQDIAKRDLEDHIISWIDF